jgi:TRAP-type C4-dicarboxylate transport system substrate-binding protein
MIKRTLLTAAAVAALASAPALAQQTIKITLVSAPPPTVTPTKVTKEFFVPEVTKRLQGSPYKIEWTEAYSQTLAKFTETFETVEEGIAQIGVQLKNFEEAKLPMEQYASMIPFGATDPKVAYQIDRNVRAKVPEMQAAFLKYNQVALAHAASTSMQMMTKFPLTKVDDLKGRKIGGSGALAQVLRGTGAVIVTANMAQSYTDISNGVYDGYPIGITQGYPYKTYQAAPYYTEVGFGATLVGAITINKKTYDALPAQVRKVIEDTATEWSNAYYASEQQRTTQLFELMKKEGMKASQFPAAERQKWAMMMPNIAKDWAQNLDKKGEPGTKVLTTYMNELRAAKVPLVREWDKQ